MTVSISPVWNGIQFFDNLGQPLSGGKIFQYEAGSTSIQQTTYADDLGAVPNSNPIILDSSGRMLTDLWLTDGSAYNLILTLADGTSVLTGVDNVIGVVSSSASSSSTAIWSEVLTPPTYVGPTQFLVAGNLTTEFSVGNRVQIEYTTNSFKYGTVLSRTYSSPNTQVTLVNDAAVQNSGMTKVYWSLNVTNGRTVDAGAVTSNAPSTYTTPLTVGYALNTLTAEDVALNTRIDKTFLVWDATGTNNVVLTPSPAITSYATRQRFTVRFINPSSGAMTININGVGAASLLQYNPAGVLGNAIVSAALVSDIAYNGAAWVLLDQLPAAASVIPRGQQVFSSNSTFTVPANVYSIQVTCVGGGGGSSSGNTITFGDIESGYTYVNSYGGNGGAGGSGNKYLAVTPGATYPITIGAGGTAGSGAGNGGNGGSTVFGASLVVSTGGGGGLYAPANGASGYGSTADYGFYNVGYQIGATPKGVGAAGTWGYTGAGVAGGPGMVIVEW